jgi:integral membrane protein
VGWLQQSDPLDLPVDIVQPDGVVPLLASPDLANRWPEDLVPGFVVAAPTPEQVRGTDLALLPGPPAEDTVTRDWRNLAYSAQWFVFAGFAVVLWWRMLRDDTARSGASRREHPDDAADRGRPEDDLPGPGPDRCRHRFRPAREDRHMTAALTRFRVVAWFVGTFLLLLSAGILLRYTDLFGVRSDVLSRTVSPVHGFGYMVYLATGIDLAGRRRWRPLTTLGVLLAGTVPFLSFLAERRVTADVRAEVARRQEQGLDGETGRAAGPGGGPDRRSPAR